MSVEYVVPDDVESTATIYRAIDLGVSFFDTPDAYGLGHNEQFVGAAVRGYRQYVYLATKFGNIRGPNGERGMVNGHPNYVPRACDASLILLGTDVIGVYYQHRVDPDVSIEETVGAMAQFVEQGKVRYLGLCEASLETIRRANSVHPISAVQIEYSLWSREVEQRILPALAEMRIGFVSDSPLGRGFLKWTIETLERFAPTDVRHTHPRFQTEHIAHNLRLLDALKRAAKIVGCSPGQIALAWVLSRGGRVVPIPRTKRRHYLEENVVAADIDLGADVIADLDAAFPTGIALCTRYPFALPRKLDL